MDRVWIAIPAMIFATIAAAWIGGLFGGDDDQADTATPTTLETPTTASPTTTEEPTTSSEPPVTDTEAAASPTTAPQAVEEEPPVRWSGGEVELDAILGVDFDDVPVQDRSSGSDIGFDGGSVYAANGGSDGAEVAVLADGLDLGWAGCVETLASLVPDRKTAVGNPVVGDVICVRSRDGRIGAAEYVRGGNEAMYLQVTVWELAG